MKSSELTIRKKAFPSVSIILPVERRYPHYKKTEKELKLMVGEAVKNLRTVLPQIRVNNITADLDRMVKSIDYTKLSRGLGLYLSPYRERVIHFRFPVIKKVVVDKTFELRDLLHMARSGFNYHAVTLSEKVIRVFSGTNGHLHEIIVPELPLGKKDIDSKGASKSQKFTSFSSSRDSADHKAHQEKMMHKFILEVDRVLCAERNIKKTPLILCGSKRMMGHFASLSKLKSTIAGTVHGNFDDITSEKLRNKIEAVYQIAYKKRQLAALEEFEKALGNWHAKTGIRDVWSAATLKKGRILLVEKDYYASGKTGRKPEQLLLDDLDKHDPHFITDAVDDTIEMVIQFGGEVIFLENDMLKDMGRIALVTYF